jgi:hypothetical protein
MLPLDYIYRYWINKPEWHSQLVFETEAATMLEADDAFEIGMGYRPDIREFGVQICKGPSGGIGRHTGFKIP